MTGSQRLALDAPLRRGQRLAIETLDGLRVFGRVAHATDLVIKVRPARASQHTRAISLRRVDISYIVNQG